MIGHGGGINGFTTTIVRYPKEKHLVVILDNTGSTNLNRIGNTLAKIIYDQPYELPKPPTAEKSDKEQ